MSGGGSQTNTVQKSDPWAGQAPYLSNAFDSAKQLMIGQGPFGYNASPYTSQAQSIQAGRAMDPNSLIGKSQSMIGNTINGNYLNPGTNPYFHSAMNDALGQAASTYAGQYGGQAGANLGNSGYQESLARGLGSMATNAYANQYNHERQNQLSASQMAPALQNADAASLGDVGKQQEARAQSQWQAPWDLLTNYNRQITGQFGSQTTSPFFTNPLAQGMGMGLGALALYNGGANAGLWGGSAAGGSSLFGSAGAADTAGTMAMFA